MGESGIVKAVDDIKFILKRGETLGIVGESGSGKSVTALSIMRLLDLSYGQIVKGSVVFSKEDHPCDLLQISEPEIRDIRGKEIAMIFQDPMTSLNPVISCGIQVSEVMKTHLGISEEAARKKTIEIFDEVNLPRTKEVYKSYPHQLSGGQRQRVMIAMAMSCSPKILIADEPTTALDVTVQKAILDLMKELQDRYGMSILFITHDLPLIKGFAHRLVVMLKGKIVEEGSAEILFSDPKHPYTKGLLNCRPPIGSRVKSLLTVESFLGQDQEKFTEVETEKERKIRHNKLYAQHPILEIRNLETSFKTKPAVSFMSGKKSVIRAVDDISFSVYPGETLGIVGESGCGKTTLGRTILRLIQHNSGKIIFNGQEIQGLSGKQLRRIRNELQIVFQDPYSSLNPRMMIGDALTEPIKIRKKKNQLHPPEVRAKELLTKVGLEEDMFYRYPHEFSGGQRQRICIARALASDPKMIVCDESVSALDVSVQAHILNLLNELKKEFGFTYLFISHDLSVVRYMSDRVMVMKGGKIEEFGDADAVYQNPRSTYTKKLIGAIP